MIRVTFYIDGFNFYYGLRRKSKEDILWKRFYWLDVVKFCESFLSNDQQLQKVIYFTASPLSPAKNSRQSAFLNANKFISGDKFEIVRGKYMDKHISCPYCHGNISKPEEKKTDVNISVRMIDDCIQNATDRIILVSADTDLIPPLEIIKKRYPEKTIKVYFPPSNFSSELNDVMKRWMSKTIKLQDNKKRFENAVMPEIVSAEIHIPEKWKNN